ncbi:hypothetical protein BDW59DRAFT_145026 [Aspergillus cavernicola]|uniref:Zn(2)-C6 fungal-type domain-containing protein n=1 Tax=Aspergillus cavernicola TaxID=176166 RepID=A0ABR4IG10_9EURO
MAPCRTCRSRKKACNGARPECSTCRISGRQCAGYEPHVKGVFVNLDATTMESRMKSLIGNAIEEAKARKPEPVHVKNPRQDNLMSTTALSTLDLSPGEFQTHFLALWTYFKEAYARTPSCWSVGVSNLSLDSKALDMALISLATIRLSFTGHGNNYLVFSLSAYNTGLQAFRRILQSPRGESNPQLVVISLIFTLFEASQRQPTRIYESGWEGHLTGALALMKCQGPGRFQNGGFHVAFKKVREMAVLLAFTKREGTFLAESQWMEIPWKMVEKTSRDRLFDIALRMTTLYSRECQNSSRQYKEIYDDLLAWKRDWLRSEIFVSAECPNSSSLSLSLSLSDTTLFPNNEFSYTSAEYTALLLLLTHMTFQPSNVPSNPNLTTSTKINYPETEVQPLRTTLQTILTLPCFGRALSDAPGITEGRCRSLFPIWVLSQTTCTSNAGVGDYEDEWWGGLYGRVNFGVG